MFNQTIIAGATNSIFLFTNVQTVQAGRYSVAISNALGAANSSNAMLIVFSPTNIAPLDLTEANAMDWGTFASDSAVATTTDAASFLKDGAYSLRFDTASGFDTGVKYPAANSAHWNLTDFTHLAFWVYGINTNQYGFQGNQPNVVLNCTGGTLTYQPASQLTLVGQWNYVRVPFAGESGWQVVANGSPQMNDVLSLEVHQDTWGYGFTSYFDGMRFLSLPKIIVPPANLVVAPGSNAVFAVTASSATTASFQWLKEGLAIAHATNATLFLPNVRIQDFGTYQVVVANLFGSITSAPASLQLTIPVITVQPQSVSQVTFANAAFAVTAVGPGPLGYQWQLNNTNLTDNFRLSGSQSNYLSISNLALADAGSYRVVVTNAYGSVTSTNAMLWVSGRNIKYSLVDLGVMLAPYTNSAAAIGISTNGQILLEGSDSQGAYHLFLNTNGNLFDVGTLPAPHNYKIFGSSMNASGSFTGTSESTNYNNSRAFLYSNGFMTDLGTLAASYDGYSYSDGMNDNGQIVGESYDSSGTSSHIFIYDHGQMTDLGDFGLQAVYPSSLNNSNQIIGQGFDANNIGFAFSYNSGQINNLGALLSAPYNYYSRGVAINDSGAAVVIGENTNYDTSAFLVISNAVTDLGTLGLPFNVDTSAFAMNNKTQIVGVGGTANGLGRAFLYESGQMQDLNNLIDPKLGWRLIQGLAINDFGQIVGYGKINEAPQHRAYLLNPIRPPALTGAQVASGQFSFMVSGVFPAQQIVVQSSTNLLDWLPMATNTVSGSVQAFAFTNQINPAIPAQYWRAVISQ